jgi:hypothetical protein
VTLSADNISAFSAVCKEANSALGI